MAWCGAGYAGAGRSHHHRCCADSQRFSSCARTGFHNRRVQQHYRRIGETPVALPSLLGPASASRLAIELCVPVVGHLGRVLDVLDVAHAPNRSQRSPGGGGSTRRQTLVRTAHHVLILLHMTVMLLLTAGMEMTRSCSETLHDSADGRQRADPHNRGHRRKYCRVSCAEMSKPRKRIAAHAHSARTERSPPP